MAFTKLTNSDFTNKGVSSLPNQPKIGATALKAKFDELSTDVITPAFNNHIDELEATTAAESIGIVAPEGRGTSENIQGVVDKISLDLSQLEGSFGSITEEIAELEEEIEAAGDMQKSVYDSNDDGVVNSADTLNGLTVGTGDLNTLDGIRDNVQDQLDEKLGRNDAITGGVINFNDPVEFRDAIGVSEGATFSCDVNLWGSTVDVFGSMSVGGDLEVSSNGDIYANTDYGKTKINNIVSDTEPGLCPPYMELEDTATSDTFTFTDEKITEYSTVEVYTDTWGDNPSNVEVTNGQCVVTFDIQKYRSVKIIVK